MRALLLHLIFGLLPVVAWGQGTVVSDVVGVDFECSDCVMELKITPNTAILCEEPIQLNAIVSNNIGAVTYLWSDESQSNTKEIIVNKIGTYYVTVTDENGCTETASVSVKGKNQILEILTSLEFEKIDIPVKVNGPISFRDNVDANRRTLEIVTDLAKLELTHEGRPFDIKSLIEHNLPKDLPENTTPHFFVVSNNDICGIDFSFDEMFNSLLRNLPHLGGIIFIQDLVDESLDDEIYLFVLGGYSDEMTNNFAIGDLIESYQGGATSFQDLINTVRRAEELLIQSGMNSIEDRIKTIRGIYYGTEWSMDFSQMQSHNRNAGFNAYTASDSGPINPEAILGSQLFNKLFNSPEVRDGNKGVDWGHVIIGMDARLSSRSRSINFPLHEETGLEICTWVGDLGGGAGKLAWERVNNPGRRAISKFNTSHFGGWINLEGDIGGYLVARDENLLGAPSLNLNDDDFIAEALESYLSENNNEDWRKRGPLFYRMITQGRDIQPSIDYLANKIEDFAENYLIIRGFDGSDIDLYEASSHLKGASVEIATIFVHALRNSGGSRIRGTLDISPTQRGEPYYKYKSLKRAAAFKEKLKEWMRN
ncbi:MAG: PKD domain-containing protein [Bacteroidota bacterium]